MGLRMGFPGGSEVMNPSTRRCRRHSIPRSRRSPGGGNGNPLQYSCMESPMNRGIWWGTVLGVAKSWTWLSIQTCTVESTRKLRMSFWIRSNIYVYQKFYTLNLKNLQKCFLIQFICTFTCTYMYALYMCM